MALASSLTNVGGMFVLLFQLVLVASTTEEHLLADRVIFYQLCSTQKGFSLGRESFGFPTLFKIFNSLGERFIRDARWIRSQWGPCHVRNVSLRIKSKTVSGPNGEWSFCLEVKIHLKLFERIFLGSLRSLIKKNCGNKSLASIKMWFYLFFFKNDFSKLNGKKIQITNTEN
jgi:hypothetical protein